MDNESLKEQARRFLRTLAAETLFKAVGSATVSIYDTAWLALVFKQQNGKRLPLFPECLQYIWNEQSFDGGWSLSSSQDDRILSSLVALLALIKHNGAFGNGNEECLPNMETSILKAKQFLQASLLSWDVERTVRVSLEIVLPSLLSLLEMEGVRFEFPGQASLQRLNAIKMAKFNPEMLYDQPTPFLHSLEALIGKVDFDRLGQFKTSGSMMASPASTAAYLMNASQWDLEAENYLNQVIQKGMGKGSGGVPTVFPTSVFETTWTLSTLLQSGYSVDDLDRSTTDEIGLYLEELLSRQNGVSGFAPLVIPDSDDTARAILCLYLLKKNPSAEPMTQYFRTPRGHFRTFPGERDASFSANCNVLKAFLESPLVEAHGLDINQITAFLCDLWWAGTIQDKWNSSLHYSTLLLTEALTRLLWVWDEGRLESMDESFLYERVPVVLVQAVNQTLFSQKSNGAWGSDDETEQTAYSILTLKALLSVPWILLLRDQILTAIEAGQQFLLQNRDKWSLPTYTWIGKITYGLSTLNEAYCLAAATSIGSSRDWSPKVKGLVEINDSSVKKAIHFFSALRTFHQNPAWQLKASVLEGLVFLPLLKSRSSIVLPGQEGAKNAYLDTVPCSWVAVNNLRHLHMDANVLWDMMELSLLGFRVDEIIETQTSGLPTSMLEDLKLIVQKLCATGDPNKVSNSPAPDRNEAICNTANEYVKHQASPNSSLTYNPQSEQPHEIGTSSDLVEFEATFGRFTRAMLTHPRVQGASPLDKALLRTELCAYLLAHITQINDNAVFTSQKDFSTTSVTPLVSPQTSFYHWTFTIGVESVCSPLAFVFLTCLLGSSSSTNGTERNLAENCFPSARHNYLAGHLCAHVAALSRLYNDYGSVARDRAEGNLNSINFPEFHMQRRLRYTHDEDLKDQEKRLKSELLGLADWERGAADRVKETLAAELRTSARGERIANGLELFSGVAQLYGDMYVARDLSNSVKN